MKLEDWLKARDLTQIQFAEISGVDQPTISRIIKDPHKRKPGWEVLVAIARATDGEVTPNDFLDIADSQTDAA